MNILDKLKKFLAGLLPKNHTKKLFFNVESFNLDADELKKYMYSLGWYLDCLRNEGRVPANIIHISTIGRTEKEVVACYDDRVCDEKTVVEFLRQSGVEVSKSSKKHFIAVITI